MPWNNQGGGDSGGGGGGPGSGGSGGGSGGGGGNSPWGRRPGGGGGGPQPPDIDEIIRKSQDRLKRILPGGIGGAKGLILVTLVLIGVLGSIGILSRAAERGRHRVGLWALYRQSDAARSALELAWADRWCDEA